jgi:hypothetical protein
MHRLFESELFHLPIGLCQLADGFDGPVVLIGISVVDIEARL